jgi:large subunit ribosomal protein L6
MSRIGKKPVPLPKEVTISIHGDVLTAKGPKGTLSRSLPPAVEVAIRDGSVAVTPHNDEPRAVSYWGLARQIIANMVHGVSVGFSIGLEIQGGGYKALLEGRTLVLALGFAHDIRTPLPETVSASIKENIVTLTSPDNELLGKFAAQIRGLRPPDPYRGKGIRYVGEVIRKKEVKAATQQAAAA